MSMLRSKDRKKEKLRIVQRSKAGKINCSQNKTDKQNDVHETQLDVYKESTFYESGVAVSLARKKTEGGNTKP